MKCIEQPQGWAEGVSREPAIDLDEEDQSICILFPLSPASTSTATTPDPG